MALSRHMPSVRGGPSNISQPIQTAHESNRGCFLDPWLISAREEIRQFAESLEMDIRRAERRTRLRKDKDLAALRTLLNLVMANFAYALVSKFDPPAVAVPLAKPGGKRTRYERPGLRHLPTLLNQLANLKLIQLRKSRQVGRASSIEPSESLLGHLNQVRPLRFEDFGRSEGEEVIVLSRTTKDAAAGTRETARLEYADTSETRSLREEMQTINRALASADLRFQGAPSTFDTGPNRRVLRRIFNLPPWLAEGERTFQFGGRLYHGWWANIEAERRWSIWISGGRIADLDFESMFLRLSYLRVGVEPPAGDLYAGILENGERYREGLKQVVNAMLFRTEPLQRLPRGSPAILPPGSTAGTLRAAILKQHPALRSVFETGVGFALMRTESNILVEILLRLIKVELTALPMHDGIMVQRLRAAEAREIMGDVSEQITGFRLPVKVTQLPADRPPYAPS